MGWDVIGNVNIDYSGTLPEKTWLRIKRIIENEGCYDLQHRNNSIWFTASGNKGVDYEFMEEIKKLLKENKLVTDFEMSSSEYIESGDGGYYYSSTDDEEDEKNAAELSQNG